MLKRKSANDPYHEVLVGCSKRAGSSPKINARERVPLRPESALGRISYSYEPAA